MRRFLALLILLATGCNQVRPPPRVTKCLINHPEKRMDCINSFGTKFKISYASKEMDKHICIPGDQFIDTMAWMKELIVIMTEDLKRSK